MRAGIFLAVQIVGFTALAYFADAIAQRSLFFLPLAAGAVLFLGFALARAWR